VTIGIRAGGWVAASWGGKTGEGGRGRLMGLFGGAFLELLDVGGDLLLCAFETSVVEVLDDELVAGGEVWRVGGLGRGDGGLPVVLVDGLCEEDLCMVGPDLAAAVAEHLLVTTGLVVLLLLWRVRVSRDSEERERDVP
jgi:hypothetical protein